MKDKIADEFPLGDIEFLEDQSNDTVDTYLVDKRTSAGIFDEWRQVRKFQDGQWQVSYHIVAEDGRRKNRFGDKKDNLHDAKVDVFSTIISDLLL